MTALDSTTAALAATREDRRGRLAATVAAVGLGLGLSLVHWLGLLLAGALVALPQRSLGRGVAAGVGTGALVVAGFLGRLARSGTLDPALAMGQPIWLAIGVALLLPAFGSLGRGVV